ncbi:hypothetical protein F4553_002295 [Allocatelliglobosispora scoriae]|uniref:ARB-07466-like C-terminal domain-containing protein n=1 Tax=Allocatelliglobosispora scoriae TaxID=643052 RepID=A0A841BNP8_9ACTN|nr:hypothetical protein [Allocatelliglobosispora scoriae]MBB5868916.1 hypothetical protein [Allocatelliglobosispora scoriae]
MTLSPLSRRWLTLATAILAALYLAVALPDPASAEPDDEGHSPVLTKNLESAARGYLEAEAALESSQKKQKEITARLAEVEKELGPLRAEIAEVATIAYQNGRLGTLGAMLAAGSPDDFLNRAMLIETMAQRENGTLASLMRVQADIAGSKSAIDAEVKTQAAQVAEMSKRKKAAELALGKTGGTRVYGLIDPKSPAAKPAPRNSDGSWPKESCTVNDPTTSHCITPRTAWAYNQTKAAVDSSGKKMFTHYVSCYRPSGSGEHPKGRACDWAAATNGFENKDATGADRLYGDKLASFYIKNASRLGVMYVIWYRRIWMPGLGWRAYSGKGGPAGTHTNHVHLSML